MPGILRRETGTPVPTVCQTLAPDSTQAWQRYGLGQGVDKAVVLVRPDGQALPLIAQAHAGCRDDEA